MEFGFKCSPWIGKLSKVYGISLVKCSPQIGKLSKVYSFSPVVTCTYTYEGSFIEEMTMILFKFIPYHT